ncbi:unnamed protein product [Cuscuta europaea]|uniref:WIT1/2 N-terminal helical bundle domain-containing protein n=1 Tax=Cuscuta europaea TaxID=41803 RepID=A0A9P0ZMI7_CUSEU|nr:unnamed protein product [Cuscuta europaea]
MEAETHLSTAVPISKIVEDKDTEPHHIKVKEVGLNLTDNGGKKEDDDTDGEFIKVEKETLESKELAKTATGNLTFPEEDIPSSVTERSLNVSSDSREFLETQEKVRDLEVELERVTRSLKDSDSQKAQLSEELSITKEKLGEIEKNYEELGIDHARLKEEISDSEGRHSSQISALQDAINVQEVKHEELESIKDSFHRLTLEYDSSRKKTEELEQDLQDTADEARKFEEFHKQSGFLVESETKRALELERLLDLTKESAKDMEDQMASLQADVKVLREKIAHSEEVEEELKTTSSKLSSVQGELEASRLEVRNMEERLTSKEEIFNELNHDLDMSRASESQLKQDILSLQNQYFTAKGDLETKILELEKSLSKLEEEVGQKEKLEAKLRGQDAEFAKMVDELGKLSKENESLDSAVSELTENAVVMKQLCSDLEAKLQSSDDNFCKSDTLLSQALTNIAELEQKLKTLEELHNESGNTATAANQKNFELEELLRISNSVAEDANAQLVELKSQYIAVEHKNLELVQQLNLVELKSNDAEREAKEISEKVSELDATLIKVTEEKEHLSAQVHEFQDKIAQVEHELKVALDQCSDHEGTASTANLRNRELEDLMHISHSKVEETGKKVSELELLLETEKYRFKELEEQIVTLEKKCEDAETNSNQYRHRVSELEEDLKAFQSKSSSFETALESAAVQEKKLTECLNVTTEDKRNLEEAFRNSTEKLVLSENLLQVLRTELNATQQRLESIENDLNVALLREGEVMEKLKSAEEQLEKHGKSLEEATMRSLEFESQHLTLSRDSELKLHEVQSLYEEKIKTLEDQVKIYEEKTNESTERSEAVKKELEQVFLKLSLSENTNEDLKKKISETADRSEEILSENEMLAATNIQLKKRVNDLEEQLSSASIEKEDNIRNVASHMNTIAELADKHTRASKMHLASEARLSETQTELENAIQKLTQKDLEAKGLMEKLSSLQDRVKGYDEKAREESSLAESLRFKLEETLTALREQEGSVEELKIKFTDLEEDRVRVFGENAELTAKLYSYEPKVVDLEMKLKAAFVERNEAVDELQASKTVIESLTQELSSEKQKLQDQLSAALEENKQLHEMFENSNKELHGVIAHLEEQLNEHASSKKTLKSQLESLTSDVSKNSEVQNLVKELEEQLTTAKAQIEQQKGLDTEKVMELESSLKQMEAKNNEISLLEKKVTELEQKLQFADADLKEKSVGGGSIFVKEDAEAKSRDIGSMAVSSPSKRKSKKKSEASTTPSASSTVTHQVRSTNEASSPFTARFILGVALVSIIIGVILGKRY